MDAIINFHIVVYDDIQGLAESIAYPLATLAQPCTFGATVYWFRSERALTLQLLLGEVSPTSSTVELVGLMLPHDLHCMECSVHASSSHCSTSTTPPGARRCSCSQTFTRQFRRPTLHRQHQRCMTWSKSLPTLLSP